MRRIVKNYEILRPLGEGGMGAVYYAIETQLRREVALKCLRPEIASNPGVLDRFRNEAQAQAKLNHPNVAHLYEFFPFGAEYFMAMEYVNGPTLSKVLRERRRLPYEEAANYATQALRGLEHAHKHGIVHRDIKPANLMLNQEGQVKVTDFGIARVSGANRATRAGMIVGTYEYISPEAAQGLPTTALSDIYSMGVVLFELLTGRLPFESQNEYELLRMHIQGARPSVRSVVKDAPGALDEIVQRAMERNVRRRFRSAEEMAGSLQKWVEGAGKRPTVGIFSRWLSGEGGREKTPAPEEGAAETRRTAITGVCRRIEDLLEQRLWSEAAGALQKGLRAYPGEPELIDLSNRLDRQRQQYEQGVAQQAELIRDLLGRGLPEAATKAADSALGTYPGAPVLLDLQAVCHARLAAANASAGQLVQVQRRVEELIDARKYEEATDYVLELHGTNHSQNELGKLLARILQVRKEAEKRDAIRQELAQAESAAATGQWEQALAILARALERFPEEPAIESFRQDVTNRRDAERRRQAAEKLIAEVRRIETGGNIEAARDRLLRDFGALGEDLRLKAELERLDSQLEAARREKAIQSALTAAAALRQEKKWRAAVDLLDRAVLAEGSDTQITEFRATIAAELRAHELQVESAAVQARALIEEHKWDEAVLRLSISIRALPGESVLSDLLQEAQRGLAQKRRAETIARIIAEANQKADAHEYSEALRLLLDAVSQYPDDESLGAALSQTVFDRDTYLEEEKSKAALARASELEKAGDLPGAIDVLRAASHELPRVEEPRRKLSELEGSWRAIRHRRTLEEVTQAVETGLDSERYPPALEAVERALAEWPDDADLLGMGRRLEQARRQSAVRNALAAAVERAAALELKQCWDEAVEVCEQTVAEYPETAAELNSRIAAARRAAQAARLKSRIEEFGRRISDYVQVGLLEEAASELAKAEQEIAGEPALANWRRNLADGQRRIALDTRVQEAVKTSRRLLEQRNFKEAQGVLLAAGSEFGSAAALELALEITEQSWQRYLDTINSALAEIRSIGEREDWDGAIAAAVSKNEQFPEEPRFRALAAEIQDKREAQGRQADLEGRLNEIRTLLESGTLEEAAVRISAALRQHPGDPLLVELRGKLDLLERARMERQRKQKALLVAEREEAIRSLLAAQRHEEALAAIEDGLAQFPEEKTFRDLRALALARIEENASVAAMAGRVRQLAAGGHGTEADRLLVECQRKYSGRAEFAQLQPLVDAARTAEWDEAARKAAAAAAVSVRDSASQPTRVADSPAIPSAGTGLSPEETQSAARLARIRLVWAAAAVMLVAVAGGVAVSRSVFAPSRPLNENEQGNRKPPPDPGQSEPEKADVGNPPPLTVTPKAISIEYDGHEFPTPRRLTLTSDGPITVEVTARGGWLKAREDPHRPGDIVVSFDLKGLKRGDTYRGEIRVSAASGKSPPLTVPVTVQIPGLNLKL
jgi:serine/threonine-protein kinase